MKPGSSTELTSLTIGDTVTVRISLNHELSESLQLELISCEYQAGGQNITIINNGTVHKQLTTFITINVPTHDEVSFDFHVFGIGNAKEVTFNCRLRIVENTTLSDMENSLLILNSFYRVQD